LVRKARGVEMPPSFWTDPLMYQGGSDSFVGSTDEIEAVDEAWGVDFEGEIAVFVDDVPMGTSAVAARKHIKLVTILNDVSLRNLIPAELNKGFGFLHGKPATAFAPVAVTPDELGDAWDGARLDQLAEVEGELGGGVGMTELPAVERRDQRQVEPRAVPGVAQLIGGHGDRREGGGGLAVEEAEALGQFGDDEVA